MSEVIQLDDEAIQMIEDYEYFDGDSSYAEHLAQKILELYKVQS